MAWLRLSHKCSHTCQSDLFLSDFHITWPESNAVVIVEIFSKLFTWNFICQASCIKKNHMQFWLYLFLVFPTSYCARPCFFQACYLFRHDNKITSAKLISLSWWSIWLLLRICVHISGDSVCLKDILYFNLYFVMGLLPSTYCGFHYVVGMIWRFSV